ncbi:NFATC2-interacting protein-like [Macrobrachium nipponense]|uniref:NFATC2-interacting protein-like n=1 Tax=Macrobrachium nipponense TaxID=159736 RepID=UPI0030C89829
MLAAVFRHRNLNLSDNKDLQDLRSFETTKEKLQSSPAWNLDVVLKFLMINRFEPLKETSFKDLTMKTLFLISLATAKRVSEIQAFSKAGNDSFDGDITVLSDVDDDAENEIVTLFVKFESNYIRCRVRQFQKLSSVYDEVADHLSVNAAQVLLCHDDKVISRDKCPVDLKLKYGAIIECGVQSQSAVLVKETVTNQSPGTIPLKVQNSDRKGVVTIFIRPDAKMKELMHRYAEEKNIPVEELHFSFDGETLNPNDTPKSLDLEGNECIDVYRT